MTELKIEDRIATLSPKAKKLFLIKLKESLANAKDTSNGGRKRIVAYVQGNDQFSIEELKSNLQKKLPDYMIPSLLIPVDEMPLLPNGKINRKELNNKKYTADKKENKVGEETGTVNEVEQKLRTIWEEVLGFSPIHKDDNFFEIGGDSILSIQIVAKARKQGIILKSNDIFDHQTIAEMSLFAETEQKEITQEIVDGEVPLSPIQHWFFKEHKAAPHFWNQAIRLDNIPLQSEQEIKKVCDYLIKQHDALRLQFLQKEGKWSAYVVAPEQICALTYIDISKEAPQDYDEVIAKTLSQTQQNFDLSKGSLFKCLYFSTGKKEGNICVLVAHHLVVDAVSWQIITDDFSTAISQIEEGIHPQLKTTSIKKWGENLSKALNTTFHDEVNFWKNQLSEVAALPVDLEAKPVLEEAEIATATFVLDKVNTLHLTDKSNKTYNTKTEELIIAALIESIHTWSANETIAIGFERHGREAFHTEIDISKTVGWFTSYFPLQFNCSEVNTIGDRIITTKELIRKVPHGGIGYGALRYLENTFGDVGNPEIVFNFLGTQSTTKKNQSIEVTPLSKGLRYPLSERSYKLEINAYIKNDELHCLWSFGKSVHKKTTIDMLVEDFCKNLLEIIEHCNTTENETYTPSDFPEAGLSQNDLDKLLESLD